ERAQAMPRQGASSGFKYGRGTGALEAIITICGVALEVVEPAIWKKTFRLRGKDKEAARQRALELFPTAHHALARRKDHGRAEAILIAPSRVAHVASDSGFQPVGTRASARGGNGVCRMSNPFLEFADNAPAAVKARQRAAEKRRTTAAQKAAEK